MSVSLLIARRLADSSINFFAFKEDGHLVWDTSVAEPPSLPWQQIRVVGLRGKEWHMDPVIKLKQVQSW